MNEARATGQESTSFRAESKADAPAKRLKVLLSAYACEPGKGSEPGLGWYTALHMSVLHDVWVLTRANNRAVIERELPEGCAVRFIYYDLPRWAMWWKRVAGGTQIYYYLWQLGAGRLLRRKHYRFFDVAHHVTFIRYWMPWAVSWAGCPAVIGPVGGGEIGPRSFDRHLSLRGWCFEKFRRFRYRLDKLDPFIRYGVRQNPVFVVPTEQSADRVRALGGKQIFYGLDCGLTQTEFDALVPISDKRRRPFVCVSSGRFVHWKGFELGIRAFLSADLPDAEYWLLGDGPERKRLEKAAFSHPNGSRIKFLGRLDRAAALSSMSKAHVLLHPSLHDTGGWVCMEAKAMGLTVVCLDLGGPAKQVENGRTGFKVSAVDWNGSIREMADTLTMLYNDPDKLREVGRRAREDVGDGYLWAQKCAYYSTLYDRACNDADC